MASHQPVMWACGLCGRRMLAMLSDGTPCGEPLPGAFGAPVSLECPAAGGCGKSHGDWRPAPAFDDGGIHIAMRAPVDKRTVERLREAFDKRDADGSGSLGRSELADMWEGMYKGMPRPECERISGGIFDEIDKDCTGEIEFSELAQYLSNSAAGLTVSPWQAMSADPRSRELRPGGAVMAHIEPRHAPASPVEDEERGAEADGGYVHQPWCTKECGGECSPPRDAGFRHRPFCNGTCAETCREPRGVATVQFP